MRSSGAHIYFSIVCVVIILGLPSISVMVLVWFLHICGDGLCSNQSPHYLVGLHLKLTVVCLPAALCCLGWFSTSIFVVVVGGCSNQSPHYLVGLQLWLTVVCLPAAWC